MTKAEAKRIAETITPDQLAAMFEHAKTGITDWEKPSAVNPGVSKGTAWNILNAALPQSGRGRMRQLAITNMVREFEDFLEESLRPAKKSRRPAPEPYHQPPNF